MATADSVQYTMVLPQVSTAYQQTHGTTRHSRLIHLSSETSHGLRANKKLPTTVGFFYIATSIAGDPIEPEDILYPTFLVDYNSSLLECNYCKVDYTETFSRYYFCSVSTENGGNMRINCALDAVKTYWEEYKGTPMTVVHNL